MLELLAQYSDSSQFFNLFNYITFRTGGAMFTGDDHRVRDSARRSSLGCAQKQGKGQPIREDGPAGHLLTKKGTPTMGGLIILISLGISSLLWADLKNPYVWAVLVVTVGFGAIGFVDDYAKVTKQHHGGLSAKLRLLFEFTIALVAAIAMLSAEWVATTPGELHDIVGFWNALWARRCPDGGGVAVHSRLGRSAARLLCSLCDDCDRGLRQRGELDRWS